MVENEKLLNSIIGGNKKTITQNEMKHIQETAKRNGDAGILESCDLNPKEKMNLAKLNGYGEHYDIKLSKDGKFYEITVKKTGCLYPDPKIYHIKKDFGLRDNVFLENNKNLVGEHPDDENSQNYDLNKIKGGTTFKIPVQEAHFDNGCNGFFGRLIAFG